MTQGSAEFLMLLIINNVLGGNLATPSPKIVYFLLILERNIQSTPNYTFYYIEYGVAMPRSTMIDVPVYVATVYAFKLQKNVQIK